MVKKGIDSKDCRNCGFLNSAEINFCNNCGFNFQTGASYQPQLGHLWTLKIIDDRDIT
ncbi:MAG: hypothetical protein ACW99Q_20740 [Candidatus Kariarchaeaceae archaeon]